MATLDTSGQIITFYSYKGGTGRTMALANVACVLAQRAHSKGVLMIDWDLEAPGLHRFFGDRFRNNKKIRRRQGLDQQPGLIDLFKELDSVAHNLDSDEERGYRLFDSIGFETFVVETDIPSLYLLKAGRFDDRYAANVNTFSWENLYERAPWLFRSFAHWLTDRYQYVLIDSRTGVTDSSGICTTLMPEKLVVVFTPNRQSLTGLDSLIRRAIDYRKQSDDWRPLTVFPLPSRIETTEPQLRGDWRYGNGEQRVRGYQPMFEAIFEDIYGLPECKLETYFSETQIQHVPSYAYGEQIAVLTEHTTDRLSLKRSYEAFTELLMTHDAPWEDQRTAETNEILLELDRAIQFDPGFAPAYHNRAIALMNLGNYKQALHDLDQSIALDPTFVRAYSTRSELYINLGQYDAALEDLTHIITLDSKFAPAYSNRANVFMQLGQYKQSRMDLDLAIKLDPSNPQNYLNLGRLFLQLRNYEEAERTLRRALALSPNNPDCYFYLGQTYRRMQRYGEAVSALEQGLMIIPHSAIIYQELGKIYRERNDLERALVMFNRAVEIDPAESSNYAELGLTYTQMVRFDEALHAFKQAIELKPTNASLYFYLGLIYGLMHRYDDALTTLIYTVELDPAYASQCIRTAFMFTTPKIFLEVLLFLERVATVTNTQPLERIEQLRRTLEAEEDTNSFQHTFFNFILADSFDELRQAIVTSDMMRSPDFFGLIERITRNTSLQLHPRLQERLKWLRALIHDL